MPIPKTAAFLGAVLLLLALQETVTTVATLPSPTTDPGRDQFGNHTALKRNRSDLVREYLLDLFECWKSVRSGKSLTVEEKRKCLAATGDEQPGASSQIAKAESIIGIPGKGRPPA